MYDIMNITYSENITAWNVIEGITVSTPLHAYESTFMDVPLRDLNN